MLSAQKGHSKELIQRLLAKLGEKIKVLESRKKESEN